MDPSWDCCDQWQWQHMTTLTTRRQKQCTDELRPEYLHRPHAEAAGIKTEGRRASDWEDVSCGGKNPTQQIPAVPKHGTKPEVQLSHNMKWWSQWTNNTMTILFGGIETSKCSHEIFKSDGLVVACESVVLHLSDSKLQRWTTTDSTTWIPLWKLDPNLLVSENWGLPKH